MGRYLTAMALLVFTLFVPGLLAAEKKPARPAHVKQGVPSLIQTIQFEKALTLWGHKIPHHIPEVRQRLEKEMLLAVWNRPQVILWLKRAGRYFPHIQKILKQENLPEDLKYVPVVESALRAQSRSSKGAVGYWQFLPSTGKKYGLRIDRMVDERRNLFKSTRAACKYIKALNAEFGSYFLAMAAYNMGEFGLNAEIESQHSQSFFDLYLPLETQRYILKIAAAKLIMENPEQYGFHLSSKDIYLPFTYSKIHFSMNEQTPLALIARAANISFKTLKDFNPDLRGYDLARGRITVLVPEGREKGFKPRFASLHKKWKNTDGFRYHVVSAGESLTGIADRYNISLASLLRMNRFSYNKVIHPGDRIRVR